MRRRAPEHPFLVEIAGKKFLSAEIDVHHIDHCRTNNDPTNLVACTPLAHSNFHHSRTPEASSYWPIL